METRTIKQVKIFVLVMNLMRDRMENRTTVCLSYDRDELIKWYEDEKAETPWVDGKYHKTFKQGSLLEWMNPLDNKNNISDYGCGIFTDWVDSELIEQSETKHIFDVSIDQKYYKIHKLWK